MLSSNYALQGGILDTQHLGKVNDLIGKNISVDQPSDDKNINLIPAQFTLINIMPHPATGIMPEIAIVAAARTSFLGESTTLERDKKLFQYLYTHQHVSPSEMSEITFSVEDIEEKYIQELVEDPRWKLNMLRTIKGSIIIRMDLNNVVAYYKQSWSDSKTNPVKLFLKQVIETVYPWTAGLLNRNPMLGFKANNEVSYGNPVDVKRYMMDDGYGDRWVEMHENSGSDEALSDILNETSKYEFHSVEDNIATMFVTGDLRPLSLFSVKFALRAPVLVLWQLVRHRSGNFNFQSGRYMAFGEDDLYLPDNWRKQSVSNKQGSSDEILTPSDFSEIRQRLVDNDNALVGQFAHEVLNSNNGDSPYSEFNSMLDDYYRLGHSVYQEMLTQGAAKEQARLFLPAWASLYSAVVKFDLMFFMRFLRLRTASDAQLEIRNYADAMYSIWKESMPITAELAKKYKFLGS